MIFALIIRPRTHQTMKFALIIKQQPPSIWYLMMRGGNHGFPFVAALSPACEELSRSIRLKLELIYADDESKLIIF